MSIIIGIDPGLSSVGYGIIQSNNSNITHICHGVIKTESGDSIGERLGVINRELMKILIQTKPDEASVELIYFAKNMKTAIPVAQAKGVILFTLNAAGLPIAEYTPLQVKQSVVGKGRADKGQIQRMMKLLLKLKEIPSPDHAADALAIAYCHSSHSYIHNYVKTGRNNV